MDNIEVIVKITINYPYSEAINFISSLCSVWGFSILKCNSGSGFVLCSFPSKNFKALFKKNPKEKDIFDLKSSKFIKKIEVLETKTKKDKKNENSMPKQHKNRKEKRK